MLGAISCKKINPSGLFFRSKLGDLEESRTPIDGMKTRCTNRYTTRPIKTRSDD